MSAVAERAAHPLEIAAWCLTAFAYCQAAYGNEGVGPLVWPGLGSAQTVVTSKTINIGEIVEQ